MSNQSAASSFRKPRLTNIRRAYDRRADGSFLTLRGDEWQMDARVVNWKPPATLLGLDPIYQLDRLSGRYSDIMTRVNEQRTVHALSDDRPSTSGMLRESFRL